MLLDKFNILWNVQSLNVIERTHSTTINLTIDEKFPSNNPQNCSVFSAFLSQTMHHADRSRPFFDSLSLTD